MVVHRILIPVVLVRFQTGLQTEKMKHIDSALNKIFTLRLQMVKEKRNDIEKALSDIEMILFRHYDEIEPLNNLNPYTNPDFLAMMKERREKLRLSFRQAGKGAGVTHTSILRMEQGFKIEEEAIKKLDVYYTDQEKAFYEGKKISLQN